MLFPITYLAFFTSIETKRKELIYIPRIKPLIEARIGSRREGRLFLSSAGGNVTYPTYYDRFAANIKKLRLSSSHAPHDCRKTFVTLCKKYKVDEYTIKRMVGHAIKDLTEEVYTDRDREWLMEEVKKK